MIDIAEGIITGIVIIVAGYFVVKLKNNARYMYHNDSYREHLKEKRNQKKRNFKS